MKLFETSIVNKSSTEDAILKIVKNVLKDADTNKIKNAGDRTTSYDLSTVSTGGQR